MSANTKPDVVHPVILSGGSGTRLWPLSRRDSPKQMLPLTGPASLLQDTVHRMSGPAFAKPILICNREHRYLVAEQLREIAIAPASIVLEPVGRNTAPAAAIAALLAARTDPDALILLAPSDHTVGDAKAFEHAVRSAIPAARTGAIVTFGIAPRTPETGYGYIERGQPFADAAGVFRVARFTEKPDRKTAETYLAAGAYFWNSGMFLFSASALLAEMERLQPAILDACRKAIAKGAGSGEFFALAEAEFRASPAISLDYAVMEHTTQAAMVPADMGWSDVGSWSALWDIAQKDGDGNVLQGDVLTVGAANSYLRGDGLLVAAVGVEDLVVVATRDAVLIARRDDTQDVKKIVDELERRGRSEHIRTRGSPDKSD